MSVLIPSQVKVSFTALAKFLGGNRTQDAHAWPHLGHAILHKQQSAQCTSCGKAGSKACLDLNKTLH